MADDPKKKKYDSKLVSQQAHEVKYLADKHELPQKLVKNIITQEGPSRASVDSYLATMKRRGRA